MNDKLLAMWLKILVFAAVGRGAVLWLFWSVLILRVGMRIRG